MSSDSISLFKRIDWVNTAFLVGTPILTLVLVPIDLMRNGISIPILVFSAIYLVMTSISITGGYHRLFSHRSYEANPWLRLFYLVFGAAAVQNSALKWCKDHRLHHRYVDQKDDPYNINEGFFYAHMGWVCLKESPTKKKLPAMDLEKDPLVAWQYRNYLALAIGFGFVVPTLVGWYFGNPLGGFVWGGLVRVVFSQHCTFLINSACHYFGSQPYNDKNSARDSAVLAIFSYGEGYHNFHHQFEYDYRNGYKWYQWDPTKWMITTFSWFGVTKNLRKVTSRQVLSSRMKMSETRLRNDGICTEKLEQLKEKVDQAQIRLKKLMEDYQRIKKEKHILAREKFQEQLRILKSEIREARQSFKAYYTQWNSCFRALKDSSEPLGTLG